MDFSLEDTQNAAPGLTSMAEQHKLSIAPRKADTQSVTKRYNPIINQGHSCVDLFIDCNQN